MPRNVERHYDVIVKIVEVAIVETSPDTSSYASRNEPTRAVRDRQHNDVINVSVKADDKENAIDKAIRLLLVEKDVLAEDVQEMKRQAGVL